MFEQQKFKNPGILIFLSTGFIFLFLLGFKQVSSVAADPVEILQPSPEPTRQPSPTPRPAPTFSCCEHDIKVNQVQVVPQKTTQLAGAVQVTIDFKLDIHWRCDKIPEKDCLAFYEITLENSNWQEFKGGKWVDIAAANVAESIIPDPSLKTPCDGKNHKGTWSYSYIATITTTNPIRNTSLVFDWDVPEEKGQATTQSMKYQVFLQQQVRNLQLSKGVIQRRNKLPYTKSAGYHSKMKKEKEVKNNEKTI